MRARCFPAARAIIICAIGAIRPPLMPWRMRNAISEFADQAMPHKADESVTLTMVASSCARKEPSTATVVIFQTSGSSPPGSLEALGKRGQDLIGGANAGETREDIFNGEAVMLGVLAGAGIFNEHKGKAETGALAGGGFDAGVGGDTG